MIEGFLFILGIVTGFIGTNTGGSALILIPSMIALGLPAQSAIATARLAIVGSLLSGLYQFHKEKKVDYRLARNAAICAILGAIIGAFTLLYISPFLLRKVIGILTLTLLSLSFLKRKPHAHITSKILKVVGYLGLIISGFIGGFFGGQAILATYVFTLCFGKSISESVGTRKVAGIAVALVSLAIYGVTDIIDWKWGIFLLTGTFIGGYFGSKHGLKKGDVWLEKLFSLVALALAVKMLFFPS